MSLSLRGLKERQFAHDNENELVDKLGKDFVERAKAFIKNVSVVKEG